MAKHLLLDRELLDMKIRCTPVVLAAALLALTSTLKAQIFDEIDISFGNFYNQIPPAMVTSGTGSLGSSMVGNEFYWVCLDAGQEQPTYSTATYHVSADSSVLTAGIWGGTLDADARQGVITAATNMFYAYQDDLISSTGTEIGYGFQSALWGVSFAYIYWGATGPLSSAVIDEVVSRYEGYFATEPWLEAFLNAALIAPTGDAPVYFANPADDTSLQSVLLIPVPEPSSALLLSLTGALVLLRRRRVS